MLEKNRRRLNENLIFLAFFLLPIFDSINGYFVRIKGFYGIGSAYHLFLMLVLVIVAYFKRTIKFGFLEKITCTLVFCLLDSILINSFFHPIESITIERIEKIICTFLSISSLYRIVTSELISKKVFKKVIDMQLFLVPTITLMADLSGIGNYTYQAAKVGKIGFYTGSNEPVAVLTIIAGILFIELKNSFNVKKLFLFLESILCLILVQSKLGYLIAAILLCSSTFVLISRLIKYGRIKPLYLIVGTVIMIVGIAVGKNMFVNTIESFLARQAYLKENLGGSGLLNYISSGRTTRFESLLTPIFEGNPLYVLLKLIFGQGARFTYNETFEMDYFDAFLYGGIVVLGCFATVTFKVLNITRKKKKDVIVLEVLFLTFLFSFVGGHVWTGGVSGIYLALLVVYCVTDVNWKSSD